MVKAYVINIMYEGSLFMPVLTLHISKVNFHINVNVGEIRFTL